MIISNSLKIDAIPYSARALPGKCTSVPIGIGSYLIDNEQLELKIKAINEDSCKLEFEDFTTHLRIKIEAPHLVSQGWPTNPSCLVYKQA